MTLSMVIIGGVTRLTNSGLSITEWKPITGALPPLSESTWEKEFLKYQNSPEFQKINNWMVLNDFKKIYYVEYFHRLLGRIAALLFFLPLIFFSYKNYLSKKEFFLCLNIGILGAMQAVAGWVMVKSGLINHPHVNHFKLTIHLMMALIMFSYISFLFFYFARKKNSYTAENYNNTYSVYFFLFIILTIMQIALGGFTAGLKAGYIYNSFPLMDGHLIASEITRDGIFNFFAPVSVQFLHRFLAVFILLYSIIPFFFKGFYFLSSKLIKLHIIIVSLLLCQFALGIITLLSVVNIYIALMHQLTAFILFTALLWQSKGMYYIFMGKRNVR